ncbi:MAG: TM2 domain-containing protein [Methylococcaceae bacterium]|nr:TM2 domain-containing protein [Methylococcaceae bacterium]
MIGQIESYNPETKTGVIKCEEKTYTFAYDQWSEEVAPDVGDDVTFEPVNMSATNIKLLGIQLAKPQAVKYKYLAVFLAIFLGWLGLHRLYLGYYRIAFYQFALSVLLIYTGFIVFAPQWGFVDALLLFSSSIDKDSKGRPLK